MQKVQIVCCSLCLICLGLISFGLFLEYRYQLVACPLCIIQRGIYIILTLIAAIACFKQKWLRWISHCLLLLLSILGAVVAGRQVWLQHLPKDRIPECGPGLSYLIEVLAPLELLKTLMQGSGECAKIQWQFLGLSIAEWSLLWFAIIILASIWLISQTKQDH